MTPDAPLRPLPRLSCRGHEPIGCLRCAFGRIADKTRLAQPKRDQLQARSDTAAQRPLLLRTIRIDLEPVGG